MSINGYEDGYFWWLMEHGTDLVRSQALSRNCEAVSSTTTCYGVPKGCRVKRRTLGD